MRVLVTGGAGFIGSQVVRSLERAGHEPVVLDVLLPRAHAAVPEPPGRKFLRVDVRDADGVRREAVGSRQSAVGSRQSAVGSRQSADLISPTRRPPKDERDGRRGGDGGHRRVPSR